jgi:hypothetical protein
MQVSPLSERDNGPYPRDYSGAFAFCKILYPLVYAACCQTTSPWPLWRAGAKGAGQPTGLPSSGCDTWGHKTPGALRSLLYPG